MGDVGELLLATIVLLILAYYKVPGLKEWARGSVKSAIEAAPDPAPEPPVAQPAIEDTKPIAMPQPAYKPRFAIAPEIATLAALLDKDPDVVEAAIQVLARLCDAEEIGETAALKVGLGISPSSTSAKYKAAKAALAAFRTPPPADDPEAWEAGNRNGQLVRKGSAA